MWVRHQVQARKQRVVSVYPVVAPTWCVCCSRRRLVRIWPCRGGGTPTTLTLLPCEMINIDHELRTEYSANGTLKHSHVELVDEEGV